jgi:hypothetical protein
MDNSNSGLMPLSITAPPDSTDKLKLSSQTGLLGPFDLQCPMENISFGRALYDRCSWLIGLLLFQSCSSYILADNVELLQSHPAIIFFLTMLVGAGGNAGNMPFRRQPYIYSKSERCYHSHHHDHLPFSSTSSPLIITVISL